MKIYFVGTDRSNAETQAIKESKPQRLLCSYFYFRTKGFEEYLKKLEYKPEILLDSGAYSAWTSGKNISIIDYMAFIETNKQHIENYIALDVFHDDELTYDYYRIMKKKGFNPIPVFHYGANKKYLYLYSEETSYIALGGTVPIKDKRIIANWVNELQFKFPELKFHLLGSSSQEITMFTDVYSCDSSTWIMEAINGKPKHIKGKIEKAKYNIKRISDRGNLKQLKLI